jgi:hypothetical protein
MSLTTTIVQGDPNPHRPCRPNPMIRLSVRRSVRILPGGCPLSLQVRTSTSISVRALIRIFAIPLIQAQKSHRRQ